MSYTAPTARELLARSLAAKSAYPPLLLRWRALFAAGEIRARDRQPVKRIRVPLYGPFSPYTVDRYIPFTQWLRPLTAEAIEKELGSGPVTPEEREAMRQLAGVMGTLYGVKS